jgi:cytochrome c
VGTVPGYKYSAVLRGADFVWNRETLRALFREGPDAFLPGTKMPLQRIRDPEALAQLIEYMSEITAPQGSGGGSGDKQ